MMKSTVTIGIPAYNEELNILHLLEAIKVQKLGTIQLKEVIIYSDGSTDQTVQIVKQHRGLPIHVIESKNRKGKSSGLNAINKRSTADVLVILDADIYLKDKHTIRKLILPIITNGIDLCAGKVDELPTKSWVGKMLHASMEYKRDVFSRMNHGNNLYTCHGRIRAFSKKIYKKINYQQSINEDAYSYMFAVSNGYAYQYIPGAVAFYSIPTTLKDHELQSVRYFQSTTRSCKEFGKKFVEECYKIPLSIGLSRLIIHLVKSPVLALYLLTVFYFKVKSKMVKKIKSTWGISKTSKVQELAI